MDNCMEFSGKSTGLGNRWPRDGEKKNIWGRVKKAHRVSKVCKIATKERVSRNIMSKQTPYDRGFKNVPDSHQSYWNYRRFGVREATLIHCGMKYLKFSWHMQNLAGTDTVNTSRRCCRCFSAQPFARLFRNPIPYHHITWWFSSSSGRTCTFESQTFEGTTYLHTALPRGSM